MKHITLNDRFLLQKLLKKGYKKKEIADIIGCHINTITNELKRTCKNSRNYAEYSPNLADDLYRANLKLKGRKLKLESDNDLKKFIEKMLVEEKYSPNATLMFIYKNKLNFTESIKSVNTIYNAIEKGLFSNVSLESLPRKRKCKKKRISRKQKRATVGTSIEKRENEVLKRDILGHWEMDCVIGQKKNKRAMLVLTERRTRYEIIEVLKTKTAAEVVKALNRIEKRFGKHFYRIFKSITVDNGSEFLNYKGMEKSLYRVGKRTKIYYAHPYSSFERGSNENNNLLVRYWLPKGTNFDNPKLFNIHIAKKVQNWMNNYPRKLFDSGTAEEFFKQEFIKL